MTVLSFVSDFHSQKAFGTSYFYAAGNTYDVPPEILDEVLASGAVGMTPQVETAAEVLVDTPPDPPIETPIEPSEEAAYDDDAADETADADDTSHA